MEYTLGVKEIKGEVPIGKPEDVIALLAEHRDLERELMLVIHLDSNLDAHGIQIAAIGSKTSCCFDVSDVFREAIVRRSDAIILVHNHPREKKVEATKDDIVCTKEIYDVSKAAKIPLLDHIIIGKNDWISFRVEGVIIARGQSYVLEMSRSSMKSGGGHKKRIKNMLRMVDRMGGGFVLRKRNP